MKVFYRYAAFAVMAVVFYTAFVELVAPDVTPSPPPPEEEFVDIGKMTVEEFILIGERVFKGKGSCSLCHKRVRGRAPWLGEIAVTAAKRMEDPRYRGRATNPHEYILESMLDPSAYVVPGYGKKGTADTVSPMPDVSKPPVGLSRFEMEAVAAYIETISGRGATVDLERIKKEFLSNGR